MTIVPRAGLQHCSTKHVHITKFVGIIWLLTTTMFRPMAVILHKTPTLENSKSQNVAILVWNTTVGIPIMSLPQPQTNKKLRSITILHSLCQLEMFNTFLLKISKMSPRNNLCTYALETAIIETLNRGHNGMLTSSL